MEKACAAWVILFCVQKTDTINSHPWKLACGADLKVYYPAIYCCSQNILLGEGVLVWVFLMGVLFVV